MVIEVSAILRNAHSFANVLELALNKRYVAQLYIFVGGGAAVFLLNAVAGRNKFRTS